MKRRIIKQLKGTLVVNTSPNLPRPWSELRPMIAFAFRFARSVALKDHKRDPWRVPNALTLKLTRGNSWRGRAWGYRCLVRMGRMDKPPYISRYPRFREMPEFWISNWQETLVGLVVHELWHLHRPGHGKEAEYDCELMEWDSVEAWRKHKGYTFTPPTQAAEPTARPDHVPSVPHLELATAL